MKIIEKNGLENKFISLLFAFLVIYPGTSSLSSLEFNQYDRNEKVSTDTKEVSLNSAAMFKGLRNSAAEEHLTDQVIKKFKIWPYGDIPYYIDDFSFDQVLTRRLRSLLNSVNIVTGLNFMELTHTPEDEKEKWVLFINRRGILSCEDYNTNSFTDTGVQRVVVGYDCLGAGGGALAPTVLALAGVPPQHNAPDRDIYIKVEMNNIIPEKRGLFRILSNNEWLFHDIGYDFLSAGHYDFHKYTINGSATIIPQRKINIAVGELDGFSFNDIKKIRMLYRYISHKIPKTKASDCSLLFKPTANFQNYEPREKTRYEKRIKPKKYSPLSNYKPPQISAKKAETSKSKDSVLSDKERDENKNYEDSFEKMNYKKRGKKIKIRKQKHNSKKSKLMVSDFNTSE